MYQLAVSFSALLFINWFYSLLGYICMVMVFMVILAFEYQNQYNSLIILTLSAFPFYQSI